MPAQGGQYIRLFTGISAYRRLYKCKEAPSPGASLLLLLLLKKQLYFKVAW